METEWRADTGRISLLKRGVATLLLARKINKRVKQLEREIEEDPKVDEEDKIDRWEKLHRQNAQDTYKHIIKYKGFLSKVGQGLSARDGGIPQPWREEMRALQDHLPVSSFKKVGIVVQAELGRSLQDLFTDFSEKPLASATVGQAHVAQVKSTGQKVCVKVQHEGVSNLMQVDFACIEYIAKKAITNHKTAPDFTDIIKEWRRASRDEVDFTLEMQSAKRASQALAASGLNVKCPVPLDDLCSKRVLTMEFIEGWKITEVERLPPGTDVSLLARQVVEAWIAIIFAEGVIHGDPHPGNVFVEPCLDGSVRPVLLDWGIVQNLTLEQRYTLANWIAAVLSQDRVNFLKGLQDLGFKFTEHFEAEALDDWMQGSIFLFRDSLPADAQKYLFDSLGERGEEERKEEEEEKKKKEEEKKEKAKNEKRKNCCCCGCGKKKKNIEEEQKLVDKIPGIQLMFTRGLSMLQGMCSTLNVTIQFAEILLRHAKPLLTERASTTSIASPPSGLGARSNLDTTIFARLERLDQMGKVLGAQVAVLRDDTAEPTWACDISFGSSGIGMGPVTETTLMPLLDVGTGVLTMCLLLAMSGPTSTGATVGLETPVQEIWPEFAQHGKKDVTIGQLLQHRAAMTRPFPSQKMNLKHFCSEKRMEDALASTPAQEGKENAICPVLGFAVAALIRRVKGTKVAAEAITSILQPLGLSEDITFAGEDSRTAWVGRKPIEHLGLSDVFEKLDEEKQKKIFAKMDPPEWLSWKELDAKVPACTDPLLPNHPDLRAGNTCATGRGLRGTAKAICRLFATEAAPLKLREHSVQAPHLAKLESLEEWNRLSRCSEFGNGWQLFRFSSADGGKDSQDVIAYGYSDGATGSVALRLPGISIAVLLNEVPALNESPQHIGFDLLSLIAKDLGLMPRWHLEVPNVPAKVPLVESKGDKNEDLRDEVRRLQEELKQLKEAFEHLQQSCGLESAAPAEDDAVGVMAVVGTWKSVEIQGLESLLTEFKVPSAFHFLALQAERKVSIEWQGTCICITSSTSIKGNAIEDTTTSFELEKPFESKQSLGGVYHGLARLEPKDLDMEHEGIQALVLKKQFTIEDKEVVLNEQFMVDADGHLVVTTSFEHGEKVFTSKTIFARDGKAMRAKRATNGHSKKQDLRAMQDSLTEIDMVVPEGSCICTSPCGTFQWVR